MDYLMLIWSPELIKDAEVSNEVSQLIGVLGQQAAKIFKQAAGSKHQPEHTVQTAMMMMTSSILVYCLLHTRFGQETLPLGDESYIRELVRSLMHGLTEEF